MTDILILSAATKPNLIANMAAAKDRKEYELYVADITDKFTLVKLTYPNLEYQTLDYLSVKSFITVKSVTDNNLLVLPTRDAEAYSGCYSLKAIDFFSKEHGLEILYGNGIGLSAHLDGIYIEFSVDVFSDLKGNVEDYRLRRRNILSAAIKGCWVTEVITVQDYPELKNFVELVLDFIHVSGIWNFQFFYYPFLDHRCFVFDINPRIGGTAEASSHSGLNIYNNLWNLANNTPRKFFPHTRTRVFYNKLTLLEAGGKNMTV